MLDSFNWDERFRISLSEDVLTPALVVYPDNIAWNIERTVELLGGDPGRWRVHIKTAKLDYALRMLLERGVCNFKCATTLELLAACGNGATDVLFAYPTVGRTSQRVREISEQFPQVKVSVLVEGREQAAQWRRSHVGIFIDINPGMDRTGIEQARTEQIAELATSIVGDGLEFRGIHYYDGQYGSLKSRERTTAAHAGYDQLMKIVEEMERRGTGVEEVITAGTPTFPGSLSYEGFRNRSFVHRVSPGTLLYNDATSLDQLPTEYAYRPAVLVLSRVVSRPRPGVVTCDAGHKAVSADAGVPTCIVIAHPELTPLSPSEEHLPLKISEEVEGPSVNDVLFLLPRHICPTVNNFDCALVVRHGEIESVQQVSARGHEVPAFQSLGMTLGRNR